MRHMPLQSKEAETANEDSNPMKKLDSCTKHFVKDREASVMTESESECSLLLKTQAQQTASSCDYASTSPSVEHIFCLASSSKNLVCVCNNDCSVPEKNSFNYDGINNQKKLQNKNSTLTPKREAMVVPPLCNLSSTQEPLMPFEGCSVDLSYSDKQYRSKFYAPAASHPFPVENRSPSSESVAAVSTWSTFSSAANRRSNSSLSSLTNGDSQCFQALQPSHQKISEVEFSPPLTAASCSPDVSSPSMMMRDFELDALPIAISSSTVVVHGKARKGGGHKAHCLVKHPKQTKFSELPPSLRIFEEFESEAQAFDRQTFSNHYLDQAHQYVGRFSSRCRYLFLKAEGWILAAAIAMLTSFSAAWIEISVKFLSDLRIGYCRGMMWQDRSFCCGSRSAVDFEHNACSISQSPVVHMGFVDHARWVAWSSLFQIHQDVAAYIVDYAVYVLIGVTLAILAAWLCQHFARSAAGSGIPEVKTILGGFVMKGVLEAWTCLIKCVGLSLSVASGLSLGKEGPLVHVACCWANLLGKLSVKYSDNEQKKRELLSAASAGGVSVAFGAPLGGVLFSLEEVSSYFPPKTLWKSFFCAIIGALSLKYLDVSGTGRLTMFQMDSVSLLGTWQIVELIPFAFIGLLGGTLGTLFIKLNVSWMTQKKKFKAIANSPIYEVALVTLLTCLFNYPLSMLRPSNSASLEQMFSRCGVSSDPDLFSMCSNRSDPEFSYSDYSLNWSVMIELAFSALIRFIQTVFTFGIGVPAGLFIPSLTVGALCGRLIGLFMIRLDNIFGFVNCHKCIHPGVYAIVGAAAMLGGVTRVTISIVVIMFELTGGLSYVVPFMVAVMVAKWVGEALLNKSIYDYYIRLKGYPYLHSDGNVRMFNGGCRSLYCWR